METKKSIRFIEEPEELNELDMNAIYGGNADSDPVIYCQDGKVYPSEAAMA